MVKKQQIITIEGESVEISSTAELVVALDVLQGHHDREVLLQLRHKLIDIVTKPQEFYAILRVLMTEDKIFLIDALKTKIVSIVSTAGHFRDILATLSEPEVEEKLIEALGAEGLQTLIHSAEELSEVLYWVYGSCDDLILQKLGIDYLNYLIQNGYEFSLVLHSLNHNSQEKLIQMLGWERVTLLVKDRRDLAHLMRALPATLSIKLLKHFTKDQLGKIIRDDYGWRYLYRYLEYEEAAYLDQLMGVKYAK